MTLEQLSAAALVEALLPCPFCQNAMTITGGCNPVGRCGTVGCWMNASKVGVSVDYQPAVDLWNHCVGQLVAVQPCPSCHGMNTSCPDGCGRDPETGELNGTMLVAMQPEQPTCMLCAGKCRGHSLADSKAWEPEPGSQAFAVQPDDATVERVARDLAKALYGPDYDPFTSPEMYDFCEQLAKAAIAVLAAKGTGDE